MLHCLRVLQSFGHCCSLFVLKFVQMFSACTCSPVNIAATRVHAALWTLLQHRCTCCAVNITATQVYMLSSEHCWNTGVHAVLWTLLQHRCTCCHVNIAATQVYTLSCEHCCNTGYDYDAKFAWIVKFALQTLCVNRRAFWCTTIIARSNLWGCTFDTIYIYSVFSRMPGGSYFGDSGLCSCHVFRVVNSFLQLLILQTLCSKIYWLNGRERDRDTEREREKISVF